tara:strand:+ start:4998 stop:5234 length:237 start_codon:yes stop_codon:yes gene_type:complete
MTKKELVDFLNQYPDDTEVYIDIFNDDDYDSDNKWLSNVRKPSVNMQRKKLKYRRVKGDKIAQRPHPESKGAVKAIVI